MRPIHSLGRSAALSACLAGWVALAVWAPPARGQLPSEPGKPPPALKPGGVRLVGASLSARTLAPASPKAAEPGPAPTAILPEGLSPPAPATSAPGPDAAGPVREPAGAIGPQEATVSLEWVGPRTAKVGQSGDYVLVVRNLCHLPAQHVRVRVRIPSNMTALLTEPPAKADGPMLSWDLGTLQAKQERALRLKLTAESKGQHTPQASVTFTGTTAMRLEVREPKLAVKVLPPEKVVLGDSAPFTVALSNPGDGAVDRVKVQAVLSDGLQHPRGKRIQFEARNLAAGETRNVILLCATHAGGAQKCQVFAEAEGGLKAGAIATVRVAVPRLDLQVVGPVLRYLDRKAVYVLKVTNPGDAPATNVTVIDVVPAGLKFLTASDGGRHDFQKHTVSWYLGEIAPGKAREVKFEMQAVRSGAYKHKATAVGARGLHAESELLTRVEGLSALLVELRDVEDPIEAGGDTGYEVIVTNTGSKTETDIKLVAIVPDNMQFKSAQTAQGVARFREEGKTIVFEPIAELAPRADAIFRINVKALEAGTAYFEVQLSSTNLPKPVVKTEATRIYAD